MSAYCPANCSVQYLSELYICALEGCTAPPLRCRECFGLQHVMVDETGKKRTHPYKKLDESHLFKGLSFLVKIHNTIAQKFQKSFGKINKNSQYFAFQIFSTSDFAMKTFQSQQAFAEFYVLKELFNSREAKFTSSPSTELPNSIQLFTQKMFNNIQSLLLSPTQQEQLLSYYFNEIVNNTSKDLQSFIIEQQDLFTKYCDDIRQQNGAFDIIHYIKTRKTSGNSNPVYFSVSFEQFLEEKYGQKPEQQDLFTINEYVAYTWQNLPVVLLNPSFEQYIDAWVTDYNQYNQFMKKEGFQQSLLSFRMWREHAQAGKVKIQNKYFLDNFILAFVDALINSNIEIKGWKDFIKYIKDYVSLSALKKEEFINIGKYSEYFEFRAKNQGFMGHLQQSQDITFNKDYFIECLNTAFKDGIQPSKKNYKKVLASKQEQFLIKQQKLLQVNESLKNQLHSEEGEKFYIIVYNNFISDCLKDDLMPSKEKYYQFKASLLQQTDEEGIRYENDKFLLEQKESIQAQQTQSIPKSTIQNVKYSVDGAEQQLADIQGSENSSGQQAEQIECPCCAGSPETCGKPQCQMMGYCVACSL